MRVGKSYVTLGPSSALARPRWRYSPPHPTVQKGTQSAEGDGIGSRRPLIPEILPTPNPNPLRGGESKALECSRVRERGGSGVSAGPPEANAEGIRVPGNQSCRAPGRGLGARRRARGRGPGAGLERRPRAPASGDGRAGNSGSAAVVATPLLQLSSRVAGEPRVEGEGSGEGRGCARLLVPCACVEGRCASPRAPLSAGSAPAGRLLGCWPPPRLAAGAKAHQRRACRSGVPSGRPLVAGRSLAATSGTRGALQTSRASTPPRSMPGAGPPRPAGSAPGCRRTRLPAEHRARSPRRVLRSRRRRSSARSTFPRFLRPARPPPPDPAS